MDFIFTQLPDGLRFSREVWPAILVTPTTLTVVLKRHGHSINGVRSLTHSSWHNMRSRCNNPKANGYSNYGARGIRVCDRWNTFENFLMDMGERPGKEYSIERIDINGNYCPENCKWATRTEQNRNRSMCVYLTINGKCQTIKEWSLEIGISHTTISRRLNLGWSHYDAVMQKVIPGQKFKRTSGKL